MDGGRFDHLTRVLTRDADGTSRRRLVRGAAGGALCAVLGRLGLEEAAAKKCKKTGQTCGGNKQCCSKRCCQQIGGGGPKFCGPKQARCCSAAEGGGFCRKHGQCGGPVPGFPDGACCDETVEGDFFGICCNLQGPNLTGCCTADFRHCCPDEPGLPACCETGFPVCCPPLAPDLPDGYCCREGFTCGTTADEPCVPESGLRGATAERGEPGKRRGKSTPVHSPDQADAS